MVGEYTTSLDNKIIFSTPVWAMCSLAMILGTAYDGTSAEMLLYIKPLLLINSSLWSV